MKTAIAIIFSVYLLLPSPTFAGSVIGISDGDTLTVLHEQRPLKIRLANIDAPEKAQAFGTRSRQSLSNMCFGKEASFDAQDVDKYGRTVAVVRCGGVEVNRAQIERGMAWVFPKYNKDQSLPKVQDQAREARLGLWVDENAVPPWEFRRLNKNRN